MSTWRASRVQQLLVNSFTIDSITVEPKQTTFASGVNYMVDFDEWLNIQVAPVQPYRLWTSPWWPAIFNQSIFSSTRSSHYAL